MVEQSENEMRPFRRGFARRLWDLADLVQADERRRSFRAKAFRRAVWSLDTLPPDLEVPTDVVLSTPGIGPGVAALLDEYRATGVIASLQMLRDMYPREARKLRRLPRMSPVLQRAMKAELAVDTTHDLLAAIETGAAETLSGVGPHTLQLWAKVLELPPSPEHVPAHEAWVAARSLADHLVRHTGRWVDIGGEVRRVEEWVRSIDLVVVGEEVTDVERFIMTSAVLTETISRDVAVAGRTLDGLPVTITHAAPEESGTTLIRVTGPEEHANAVVTEPFPTEDEAYRAAGLALPPAPARGLPLDISTSVVALMDLKGDFHVHSEASPDGRMSLETIVEEAVHRGYEYILLTDHTQGLRFGGLDPEGITKQAKQVARMRDNVHGLKIFHGAELNIGADGSLDLPDDALDLLDFAVAGVHSDFHLDRAAQTARVVRALSNPVVRVLAHPLGRRIGIRPGLDLDVEAVIDAAIATGVALEANGHRDRLDLPAEWVSVASGRGAVFAANSDAHRVGEIDNVSNAVAVLQRAGVGLERVVNTWPLPVLETWLEAREKPVGAIRSRGSRADSSRSGG